MNEWTPVIVLFNALLKGDCYLLLLVDDDGLIEPSSPQPVDIVTA